MLKNYADIDIQLTDLFDSRTFWDSKYGTNSSPLVVLASGLAPRVSNYHQESSIPTGLFQAACFESLKLQFPSSIIILTHTGPKIKLGYLTGDPIWHGPISQDERPFPNCPDICLNPQDMTGSMSAHLTHLSLLTCKMFVSPSMMSHSKEARLATQLSAPISPPTASKFLLETKSSTSQAPEVKRSRRLCMTSWLKKPLASLAVLFHASKWWWPPQMVPPRWHVVYRKTIFAPLRYLGTSHLG